MENILCSKELLEKLDDISEELTDLRIQSPKLPENYLIDSTHQIQIDDEAYKIKGRMIRQWKINLNQRKLAHWNVLRNKETSKIYLEWSKSETPIIPRKYFPKLIDNEPENQKRLREKLAVEKLITESEIPYLRSQQYQQKYEKNDCHMFQHIERIMHMF